MNPVHLALGAAIVALAVIGLCWVLARVADGLERAWDWLEWRFRGDGQDDYTEGEGDLRRVAMVPVDETEDDRAWGLAPLPPERSREELGFTGPQPAICGLPTILGGSERPCQMIRGHEGPHLRSPVPLEEMPGALSGRYLSPHRERWAPAWEAEARSAYQALELDYPSGLLARIREQA